MKHEVLSAMTIRSIEAVEELEKVYELETIVWSAEDAVPTNHTIATVKNGGLVLGAYYEGKLIGFQYSFPGFDGKKVYLLSHSLGIHPDYRRLGVGEQLKIAQKQAAAGKGYERIVWTYDPLETVNANLNIHKLRAVAVSYIENAYGDMADGMNSGIPTDRFLVEWQVREEPPAERLTDIQQLPLLIASAAQAGYLIAGDVDLQQSAEKLAVPVPGNFQDMKKYDLSLALTWREKTRAVFSHYLNQGWRVTDLVKDRHTDNQYLYVLEK